MLRLVAGFSFFGQMNFSPPFCCRVLCGHESAAPGRHRGLGPSFSQGEEASPGTGLQSLPAVGVDFEPVFDAIRGQRTVVAVGPEQIMSLPRVAGWAKRYAPLACEDRSLDAYSRGFVDRMAHDGLLPCRLVWSVQRVAEQASRLLYVVGGWNRYIVALVEGSSLCDFGKRIMARNAIVLMIDRLGSGFLGPYGNTWVDTPALNRLASESLLFETVIGDSTRLDQLYASYWLGCHAAGRRWSELRRASVAAATQEPSARQPTMAPVEAQTVVEHGMDHPSLLRLLAQSGIRPVVVTDSEEVAKHPLASGFCEALFHGAKAPATAAAVDETRTAELFAAALQRVQELTSPFLVWVHAAAMNAAWDAPYAYRASLADEEDPPPPDSSQPPAWKLGETYDPDELLGWIQAYAGEVIAVDELIGALLDALDEAGLAEETLVVLASPRGYPLGEHGFVGAEGDQLHTELLETPLLIRDPRQRDCSLRILNLVQPADLYATLLDWFQLPSRLQPGASPVAATGPIATTGPVATPQLHPPTSPPILASSKWEFLTQPGESLLNLADQPAWSRALALSVQDAAWALRTPEWFLVHTSDGGERLYAKPDDRWEVNEVSDRCRQVIEQLEEQVRPWLG